MHGIMSPTLDSEKHLSHHSYWQLNISFQEDADLIKYIDPLNSIFYQPSLVRRFPLPFMGYSKPSPVAGCRLLEMTWCLFRRKCRGSFRLANAQGIAVYCTWYIVLVLSAKMKWWNVMACDIQQVSLNDLMVSSEYMNCWAVCQKPDRLLVFPQVTICNYPCPPELCGETPVCII